MQLRPIRLADLGRAGERDLVDARMAYERGAGAFAVAGDDVHRARREAGFHDQLGQAQRRERRFLGGLEHDRAAAGERRRDLPHRHQQREVPRDDRADDADCLAPRHGRVLDAGREGDRHVERGAFDLRRPAGHVADPLRIRADLEHAREHQQLAVVQRFEARELLAVLLDQVGQAQHQQLTLRRQHVLPFGGFEGGAGRTYGGVDVLGLCVGHAGDLLAGARVVDGQRLARACLDPLAADEHLAADRPELGTFGGYVHVHRCLLFDLRAGKNQG